MFRRAVLPTLLLLAGTGSLLYGVMFHRLPVLVEEKTVTIRIPIPSPFGAFPPGEPPLPGETPAVEEENPFQVSAPGEESPPAAGEEANPFESLPPDEEPVPGDTPAAEEGEEPGLGLSGAMERYEEQPPLFPPDPFGPPGALGGPPAYIEEEETERIFQDEPEWKLIREVSVGGVTRLANGELKRTYSGQPPSVCPT